MSEEMIKKPSILIVEDTPSQALRFKVSLESHGCDVYWAKNGEAGLEVAQERINERPFDLIVLDVEMPGINGFEVCRQLKTNPDLAHIPVIMLTTRDAADDVLTGLEQGAVDYIPKDPFAEVVLLETIRQMGLGIG